MFGVLRGASFEGPEFLAKKQKVINGAINDAMKCFDFVYSNYDGMTFFYPGSRFGGEFL